MSRLVFILLLFSSLIIACNKSTPPIEEEAPEYTFNDTINNKNHPRILLLKGEELQVKQSITEIPTWDRMHQSIVSECYKILSLPPIERVLIGRRLLDKSSEALRRIFYLSYAWRMTQEERYFKRCEKEMLAIAGFSDWNPSHFLDVAEMTMAISIGYDWLYGKLSDQSKVIIRNAIITKGINPSFNSQFNWFVNSNNNWNQVCNAGMVYGALAIEDENAELAKRVIDRARVSIKLPRKEYEPDGAYPEGYGYWDYGTTFDVMLQSALEKTPGMDNDLDSFPGLLKTGSFLQNMTGTTGQCFNWGDNNSGNFLSPAMFWLAQRNNDPSLLWVEKDYLNRTDYSSFARNRLLPAILVWTKNMSLGQITEPSEKFWCGQGANPVCMMRTSWSDKNAIFLGFKAGSPSVNHGHMDVGSFIMEANGVRWASDLGRQDYESLESKDIDLWNMSQNSDRWKVFRINNMSHSTLTINSQLQRVDGYSKIDKFSNAGNFMYAVSEITEVYKGELATAIRGVAIVDEKFVVIADELTAPNNETTVRWALLTTANPVIENNTIILTKDDKELTLKVDTHLSVTMKTWSTAPTNNYDAQNPGTILVGFETKLPANKKEEIRVLLIPNSAGNVSFNKALSEW